MCTETFLNLPEEKQNRLLNAAWEEFTIVPLSKASINQIIRRAHIPRGSFYQYFTDKKDLFSYLMEDVREQIFIFFKQILKEAERDIFQATLMAYDRFLFNQKIGAHPFFNRCLKVLRINQGMDIESMLMSKEGYMKIKSLYKEIDASLFYRQDDSFIFWVCSLSGMCLGEALMNSLSNPEKEERCRETLIEKLNIIRRGSLRTEILTHSSA